MQEIEVVKEKTGFRYTGQALSGLLMEMGRGELVDKTGAVWSSRDPESIPTGEPGGEHSVVLKTSEGSREVHLYILTVMVNGGATLGDLQKRFQSEGLSRREALTKACREYPEAHADYLEAEARKQAKKRKAWG